MQMAVSGQDEAMRELQFVVQVLYMRIKMGTGVVFYFQNRQEVTQQLLVIKKEIQYYSTDNLYQTSRQESLVRPGHLHLIVFLKDNYYFLKVDGNNKR